VKIGHRGESADVFMFRSPWLRVLLDSK